MTAIIGINAYHSDSAACLVVDGKLVAAAEEERFRRIKHWAGFPSEAIRYCLTEAGIRLGDVDYVAINQDAGANIWRKVAYMVMRRPDLSMVLDRIRNKRERAGVADELKRAFDGEPFKAEVRHVEHHLAHLASAYLVSPFEEDSVAVSVDGFGDFASAAWGVGKGSRIEVEDRVYFPHSLGIFYMALTQYLGFPSWGDEYKVMGLAPYGQPNFLKELRNVVHLQDDGTFRLNLDFFRHHLEKSEDEWDNGEPRVKSLFSRSLEELLGPARKRNDELTQRHRDLARSIQAIYEEAFFHLLNSLHERHGLETLTLAGGCAMNSVANGKIYRNTQFKKLYVQSAAGDAGGAIGAAYAVWSELGGGERFHMEHAYWGPQYGDAYIAKLLESERAAIDEAGCSVRCLSDEGDLVRETADAISQGLVVGWFQGRMEWGPRALGNRSILADPRRSDMKDILNLKIKRRESFRPFAPSIQREYVGDWFETEDEVPFMMQVYQIRNERRTDIPAVAHVDGSGRLQTVHRHTNPRYWRLIERFRELTGVPILLNTSFNENEPVVCRPEEALDCFLRTKMDVLVLGDWIVRRIARP